MTIKLGSKIILTTLLAIFCINCSAATPAAHHSHLLGSSIGNTADLNKATKTIKVMTSDEMRFKFIQKPVLHEGEIIAFEVTNVGKVPHEFSISNEQEQKAHQLMMRKMPGMTHEEGNTITINSGETKTLTWQFKSSGHEALFSCNIPGHFEAGMYKKVKIQAH